MIAKTKTRRGVASGVSGLLACSLLLPALALAAPVHLSVKTPRGEEFGAGISAGNGIDCYIVAPAHVVQHAIAITVTDRNGRSASAMPLLAPEGVDAILLKLNDGHALDCPEDWVDGSAAESVVDDSPFLVSKKVKDGGMDQRRFFPASVTATSISIQPYGAGASDRLIEGDSGSALFAQNQLLGMVVKVDTATGEGEALKQSYLHSLFSAHILDQVSKIAMVAPVLSGSQENRYATLALRDFVDANTPFDAMEMSPDLAQANTMAIYRGTPVEYPDNVDYVINSRIIAHNMVRQENPNYKESSQTTSNFGQQLINRSANRDFRYYQVSKVDVEVAIVMPKTKERVSHIERLEYRTPLRDDTNAQEIASQIPVKASIEAVQATMIKNNMPVTAGASNVVEDTASDFTSAPAADDADADNIVKKLFNLPR